MLRGISIIVAFFFLMDFTPTEYEPLLYPGIVNKVYEKNGNTLLWLSPGDNGNRKRKQLITALDSFSSQHLIGQAYHGKWLHQQAAGVIDTLLAADRLYTDAAIAAMKDLYQGNKIPSFIFFDPVSPAYATIDNDFIIEQFLQKINTTGIEDAFRSVESGDSTYISLRRTIIEAARINDKEKIKKLEASINFYRWVHHFKLKRYIVVNTASAWLRYYENDSERLLMKVVVGKVSTPTPRFAAFCDKVILYPYWNVPRGIAVHELLPVYKRNPHLVDAQNMQVIDVKGNVVNHLKLDWTKFNSDNFPYSFRQSTGCDNALGVIKFDINSPYGVYLHDTNNKLAFFSNHRFYSHGCIRIEMPIELGNYILGNTLDTGFLQSCYKDQKPAIIEIKDPVPVFVIYAPVEISILGKIIYYPDVYQLLKN